uniref:Uncharacterized protein n=1 Tax=Anguilla anguilla TaxID=7936 RepID=A0A0E9XKS5_ANGAN
MLAIEYCLNPAQLDW